MRALSRKFAARKSVLRNLATSLILYEQIKTTEAKAKEVKPIVELLINQAKKNNLAARRNLMRFLFDKNATKKTFEVLVPRYQKISSGYIKTYKVNPRLGDGARMMILKLINITKDNKTLANATDEENKVKTSVKKGQHAKQNNGQEGSAKKVDKKADRPGGKNRLK